jgi:hypothetical protein
MPSPSGLDLQTPLMIHSSICLVNPSRNTDSRFWSDKQITDTGGLSDTADHDILVYVGQVALEPGTGWCLLERIR